MKKKIAYKVRNRFLEQHFRKKFARNEEKRIFKTSVQTVFAHIIKAPY